MSNAEPDRWRARVYWGGVALASGVLVVACALVATRAWFGEDDFRWLAEVRSADFSILRAYLPLESRQWWSYRPLGMHSYFLLCDRLFGFAPVGFYAVSLALHFGCGVWVYRLAELLDFPPRVAAAAALLTVSRPSSIDVVYWAAASNYFSVAFFSLASLVLFGEYVERGGGARRAISWLAFVCALLCQESALLLPIVFVALSLYWDRGGRHGATGSIGRVLSRTGPHWVIAALYAIHRFALLAPAPRQHNYQALWGWNVARNALRYCAAAVGGETALVVVIGLGLGIVALLVGRASGRAIARDWLLPLSAVLGVWVAIAVAPFAAVRMTAARFAIAVEIPLCLLLTAPLAALWRSCGPRRRGWLEAASLVLVLVAMPYATLQRAASEPRGWRARRVLEQLEAQGALRPGDRLVVLYGADGAMQDGWRVHRETWAGTALLSARHPGRDLSMRFRSVRSAPPARDLAPECRYFELRPGVRIAPARPEVRESFFRAGLSSPKPGAAEAAAQRLARLLGTDATGFIVSAAEMRPAASRRALAEALLLIEGPRARRELERLIPERALRREARERMARRWGVRPGTGADRGSEDGAAGARVDVLDGSP